MNPMNQSARRLLLGAGLLLLASCASAPVEEFEPVFFPGPPDPPRVQFLRALSGSRQIEAGPSGLDTFLFGAAADTGKELLRPFGCAVRDGVVYVTDTRLSAIVAIDLAGQKMDAVKLKGRATVKKPMSIAFAEDGTCFIADAGRIVVVELDKDFVFRRELGPFGEGSRPIGVAVRGDRVYVVDAGHHCVRVLARDSGEELQVLGTKETEDEFLRGPNGVAVDENGFVYVSDTILGRVYVWNREGSFVRHIGEPGDIVGQFARPKGLALAGRTICVLDVAFENCQIFDRNGDILMFFGGPGNGNGQLNMPSSIWIGKDGLELFPDRFADGFTPEYLVVVTNQFGPNKVSFFALGKQSGYEYPDSVLPERPVKEVKAEPDGGDGQ